MNTPVIRVVNYDAGNATSVLHAVEHLGYCAELASNPHDIEQATHIILPGVGSARATMESLDKMNMIFALENAVLKNKVCFLGICVGMQILFEKSEEEYEICLGWLEGQVIRLDDTKVRVPQMGWNHVHFTKQSLGLEADDYFYFVNSYVVRPQNKDDLWGMAEYGGEFAAAVQRDNIFATQFHIEKSGEAGLRLLNQFLSFSEKE